MVAALFLMACLRQMFLEVCYYFVKKTKQNKTKHYVQSSASCIVKKIQ